MATIKQNEYDCLLTCTTEKLTGLQVSAQGAKIPIVCLGSHSFADHSPFGSEEQSILESLLLAQWEDCMWKGHFRYDVTTCELKVISGKIRFLAQLNDMSLDCVHKLEDHSTLQGDPCLFNGTKQHEGLLLFISSNDNKAHTEVISPAAAPDGSILVVINVNPVEYGHVFFVPCGLYSSHQFLNARFFETAIQIALVVNNDGFRLFYNCLGPNSPGSYFQGCYFPDCLPVESMPVEAVASDTQRGFCISSVIGYPIKTLLFESNSNSLILPEVLSEICFFLQDENIPFDLLISGCGKRVFLFLQRKPLSASSGLSTWECGGYFVFRKREEYDRVTEADMLKRLRKTSIDDESFAEVKRLCCTIASKVMC